MRCTAIALVALVTFACAKTDTANDSTSVAASAAANDPPAVQRAIDSAMVRFADAMTKGDVAGMASAYTDDAVTMPANAKAFRGRAELDKYNAGMFSQFSVTSAKFATNDLIVTGDYAIESGTYEMTMKPKTGKVINDVGKYVSIWKKQPDGSWKMIRDIFNSDQGM